MIETHLLIVHLIKYKVANNVLFVNATAKAALFATILAYPIQKSKAYLTLIQVGQCAI